MNFIFTEKLLREHLSEDIVSELFPREDIPPLSEADSQYVSTVAHLAKEKDAMELWELLRKHPADGVSEPLRSLFEQLSFSSRTWQHKAEDGQTGYKGFNKQTYQMHYVYPVMQGFFRGRGMFINL